jgi:hypothetical protein
MYTGGCLCGAIQFEIRGPIRNIVYCHCSQCRKAQGSAFASNGIVDSQAFEILTGADRLTGFEATPGQIKYFCKQCGSPIMSKTVSRPDQIRVRLGTINSDITERPGAHIFVTSKANWETLCGDLPQYDTFEPDR